MAQTLCLRPTTPCKNKSRKQPVRNSKVTNKTLAAVVTTIFKAVNRPPPPTSTTSSSSEIQRCFVTMRQCKLWALTLLACQKLWLPRVTRAPRLVWKRRHSSPNSRTRATKAKLAPEPELDKWSSSHQLSEDLISLNQLFQARALEHESEHQAMIHLIASQSSSVAGLTDSKVKIYGSRAVGLALPESDIDVALLPSTPLSEAQQQRALALLGEALQESGGWATGRVISCLAVTVTAIPVLKVVMEHGFVRGALLPQRVALDITMKNLSADAIESDCQHAGLHGIEVVNSLKEQFEALGPVVLFMKQLLATSNLNDPYSGGLGSYALTLMVAFVLQNKVAAGDGIGQCLLAVLEYYMNTFDASKHRIFSELQSKTENVEDCAEALLIDSGAPQAPLHVYDPILREMNVGSSCFRFEIVQRVFGWAHAELSKHYVNASDVGPQLGVLLEIATRKQNNWVGTWVE